MVMHYFAVNGCQRRLIIGLFRNNQMSSKNAQ